MTHGPRAAPRPPALPPLLAISDRRRAAVEPWAASLARAGVGWLQVREKDLPDRELAELARRCRQVAGGAARVMINGRADLCAAAGLAGVHLPARGAAAQRVRSVLAPGALVGRSTHTLEEVDHAAAEGVDYVVYGPVFAPLSKAGLPAIGLASLAAAARGPVPVYALGGVTEERLEALAATGAAGVAGISLFTDGARLDTLARRAEELFHRASPTNGAPGGTQP
jgi:thiamine-phosphate pyrophosphorylase